MSQEKQIEEMARTLCGEKKITCDQCDSRKYCLFLIEAGTLFNSGYRKQTELAREIFEELEELAKIYTFPVVKNGVVEIAKEPFWCFEPNDLAELKEKYKEENHETQND